MNLQIEKIEKCSIARQDHFRKFFSSHFQSKALTDWLRIITLQEVKRP